MDVQCEGMSLLKIKIAENDQLTELFSSAQGRT